MTAPTFTLSPDQDAGLGALVRHLDRRGKDGPGVLVGPAGTGKTTLMGALVTQLRGRRAVVCAAPTGRAAKVLSAKLQAWGIPTGATTIHRALYGAPAEGADGALDFGEPREPVTAGGVLIIDEASMIGERIHADIARKLPRGASLLYVGDREQLPPVNESWGADFARPTAVLTEVHRQALESPIVRIATDIRGGGKLPRVSDGAYCREAATLDDVASWMATARREERDAVLLAATTHTRKLLNERTRAKLGLDGPLQPGDRLVVACNNRDTGLMNGELIDVDTAERLDADRLQIRTVCGREIVVYERAIGASYAEFRDASKGHDPIFLPPTVHVDLGWALTVYKAQGSEWKDVAFVLDNDLRRWCLRDPEIGRRLVYTGVTRARDTLVAFDVGGSR